MSPKSRLLVIVVDDDIPVLEIFTYSISELSSVVEDILTRLFRDFEYGKVSKTTRPTCVKQHS